VRLPAPETTSEAARDECTAELVAAFSRVVFDPDMVTRQQSIMPFMQLLSIIPDW
jgi:hypothetical protein